MEPAARGSGVSYISRILLIRHGRSAHTRTGWVNAAGFDRWRAECDAAPIRADDDPPAALVAQVGQGTRIVSSDLPRAVASARRLASNRPIEVNALFHEAALDIPALPGYLPIAGWDVLVHLQWMYRLLRGRDASPDLLRRTDRAAAWLVEQAQTSPVIAVVTHGVFRRLLGARLVQLGWRADDRMRSYQPWSVWSFVEPSRAQP